MGNISKEVRKVILWETHYGTLVDTGDLIVNTWYAVASIDPSASTLPTGFKIDQPFKTASATPPTLAAGDSAYPILGSDNLPISLDNRFCKTDTEISFEEGTIDVTDDCSGGYTSNIVDGYVSVSGTYNGFLKFNSETGILSSLSKDMFKRFIDDITDDGAGAYTYAARDNSRMLAFILLNSDAELDDTQNFLTMWQHLTTFGTGGGLKDAQKRDIAWVKAEGPISLYQRTVVTGDTTF